MMGKPPQFLRRAFGCQTGHGISQYFLWYGLCIAFLKTLIEGLGFINIYT